VSFEAWPLIVIFEQSADYYNVTSNHPFNPAILESLHTPLSIHHATKKRLVGLFEGLVKMGFIGAVEYDLTSIPWTGI